MATILRGKQICKTYDEGNNKVNILKNVNLEIEAGEFVAVMGQSGSGKSTLLYCISGMDAATSGEVLFKGKSIDKLPEKEISRMRLTGMGFIFQHSYLMKTMSIRDNIILPGLKAGKKSKAQVSHDAERYMEQLGIAHIAGNDTTKVSGGQLQRAAICRALINEPEIIFGDEPTGALNSSTTLDVMNILNDINGKGVAILLVTHDAKVAARADRVIYLTDGEIAGERTLGKYKPEKDDIEKRTANLSVWLNERGF